MRPGNRPTDQFARALKGDLATLTATVDALLAELVDRCTYDTELLTEVQLSMAAARVPGQTYARWFDSLPERNRLEMTNRWGDPPGESYVHAGHVALAGLCFGKVFVAIQPPRGYGMDPNLIYHQPSATHHYHTQLSLAAASSGRRHGPGQARHLSGCPAKR
jgi:cobaltochelatase CobN